MVTGRFSLATSPRRVAAAAAAVAAVLVAGSAGLTSASTDGSAAGPVSTSASLTPGSAAVEVCGARTGGAATLPGVPYDTFTRGLGVGDFTISGAVLTELDGSTVRRFDVSTGRQLNSFGIGHNTVFDVATDPGGDILVTSYPSTVVAYSPTGVWQWSTALPREITGIYGRQTAAGWRLAATTAGAAGSTLLDATGGITGQSPVAGILGAPTPTGGLVTVDGRYLHTYDAADVASLTVGDSHVGNDPMPSGAALHFYQQGGAAVAPDGNIFVADAQNGIEVVRPDGTLLGTVADSAVGGLTQRSPVVVNGDQLWFATGPRFSGNQSIVHAPVSGLEAAAVATPRLGFGAGISTGTTDSYVAPGTTPHVVATFDPWWQRDAGELTLRTTVRDWRTVLAAGAGTVTDTPLTAATVAAGIGIGVPAAPGDTEVDARLLDDTGKAVGATCLDVATGAPGDTLDFDKLPGGAGYGGPAALRDVALQGVLGTGLTRLGVDWSTLLPGGAGSTAPLAVGGYTSLFTAAVQAAAANGTTLEVQLGDGGPVESGLVGNGTWGARVRELVGDLRGTGVKNWEAWNEPNNTYGPAPAYAAKILAPFYAAVKAADPTATVLGGTVCGMDLGYWQQLIGAGALNDLDIVAIHPYPGHNRGPEEQGLASFLATFKSMLAAAGHGSLPIWDTENSFWSDGSYNWLTSADKSVHQELIFRAQGISQWSYFETEGAWGNDGVTFSAIQYADAVKPTALALMTSRTELAGRPYLGMVDTQMPHVLAERFGPGTGGGGDLVALWTDEQTGTVAVSGSPGTDVASTDEYGATSTWTLGSVPSLVTATGAVRYLQLPAGAPLRIGPAESYGADLTVGGTASATSQQGSNPAAKAIDGDDTADGGTDWPGTSAWASAPGDDTPALTVHLSSQQTLDRVLLSTPSLASVVPGVRDWDLAVRSGPTAAWTTVASVRNRFFDRNTEVSFPAQPVSDLRVTVDAVNITGYNGGAKPYFVASSTYEPAIIDELRAYAPGAQVLGLQTPDLLGAGTSGAGPDPAGPAPVVPDPAAPAPVVPDPAGPAPVVPDPAGPAPVVPDPAGPAPVDEVPAPVSISTLPPVVVAAGSPPMLVPSAGSISSGPLASVLAPLAAAGVPTGADSIPGTIAPGLQAGQPGTIVPGQHAGQPGARKPAVRKKVSRRKVSRKKHVKTKAVRKVGTPVRRKHTTQPAKMRTKPA